MQIVFLHLSCLLEEKSRALYLLVRSFSDTYHEEEETGEEDSLHRGDKEEREGVGTRLPGSHDGQFIEGDRVQTCHIKLLSQAEAEREQGQGGCNQPSKDQVTHSLFHQLYLHREDGMEGYTNNNNNMYRTGQRHRSSH